MTMTMTKYEVEKIIREDQEKRGPGCLTILLVYALALFLIGVVVYAFNASIPSIRTDHAGQRYLCWVQEESWPWEQETRTVKACIPEHHRVVVTKDNR